MLYPPLGAPGALKMRGSKKLPQRLGRVQRPRCFLPVPCGNARLRADDQPSQGCLRRLIDEPISLKWYVREGSPHGAFLWNRLQRHLRLPLLRPEVIQRVFWGHMLPLWTGINLAAWI